MRFCTGLPHATWYPPVHESWHERLTLDEVQDLMKIVDDLGYYRVIVPDHIVMPGSHVEAMGRHWLHATTAMAFILGATKRIRVMPSVLVVPYHNPIELAKALATMDYLSQGRVDLGIGVGHASHEFEALAVPFEERGARTDEYISAIKELWTSDAPEFRGRWVAFDNIAFEPKPTQNPLPIIVGGNSRAALRRAAAYGDGWNPWLITPEQLPECLDYLHAQPTWDPARPFDLYMPPSIHEVSEVDHRPVGGSEDGRQNVLNPQQLIDVLGRLDEMGVTSTSVPVPRTSSLEEYLDHVRWVAETIFPIFPDVERTGTSIGR
jgi:probable F420-dependent oxidoreductase